jgi:hypothetical protein
LRPLWLILAIPLAACAASDATDDPPSQAATSSTAGECIATPESAASIAEGLTVSAGTLRNAFAVPLRGGAEFGLLFVVAAEIDGAGLEGNGEIGTWATGELGGGPIFAANAVAQEFSDWDAAAEEGVAGLTWPRDAVATSDQASMAEACVASG